MGQDFSSRTVSLAFQENVMRMAGGRPDTLKELSRNKTFKAKKGDPLYDEMRKYKERENEVTR